MGGRIIDDALSARGGQLFIEECNTNDIAARYGTPLFVFSENQLRRNIRRFQKSFQSGWPDGRVKVMPAAKANWISAIQKIIADEGCGCDIYSPGELAAALNAGFDPRYISVNGVPKDADHVQKSIKAGALLTIDSIEEIDLIEQAARKLNTTARVRLRLKPAMSGFSRHSDFVPGGPVPTDLVAMLYKGGLSIDQVIELGKRIVASDLFELTGFHQHHGRHHRSTRYWVEQMKTFARDIGIVSRALDGFQPREIDIGGGFACPRDPFNAETSYSEPYELLVLHLVSKGMEMAGPKQRYRVLNNLINKLVSAEPNTNHAPAIEQYAHTCTSTLRAELPRHGIDTRGLMLQLEPGRGLHGNTAIHLTSVKNIKQMQAPIKWTHLIMDTTEFWFTGGRYEHHLHDYLFVNQTEARLEEKVDIIGRSCYGDRLLPTVRVPRNIKVGDVLALLDVGAYQEVSMSNFNAIPRPASLLVTEDRVSVIRRAETQADVFSRDEFPEHLYTDCTETRKEGNTEKSKG